MVLICIFLGGGFGSIARYLVGNFITLKSFDISLSIIVINMMGCFFIGLIHPIFSKIYVESMYLKAFVLVGFLGGYTTFSTFSLEAFSLLEQKGVIHFMMYIFISLFGSLLAFFCANLLMKKILF